MLALSRLSHNTAYVWVARLPTIEPISVVKKILVDEEFACVNKISHSGGRARYLWTRSLLRIALSVYTGEPPRFFKFTTSLSGKPKLAEEPMMCGIQFSVSHSYQLIACAVAKSPIGVDVEWTDRSLDWAKVARKALSERELEHFYALSPDQKRDYFYRYWTAKEAYVKAIGKGLFEDIRTIEFDLLAKEHPKLLRPLETDIGWWFEHPATSQTTNYCLTTACRSPGSRPHVVVKDIVDLRQYLTRHLSVWDM